MIAKSQFKLKKGDKAPDFSLKATDGKTYSLNSFKNKKAILVIFTCNHCPFAKAKMPELNRIAYDFKDIEVIGINSNDETQFPEDSFEKMKEYVANGKVKFLYLQDKTQDVAKSYGAVCTPDPFLFDSNFKLVFHSRIDFPPGLLPPIKHEMYQAISEFLETGNITLKENPSMGCSIKWKI